MCCLICLDWEKGKLTNDEALRNLGELLDGNNSEEQTTHYFELALKLSEDEDDED